MYRQAEHLKNIKEQKGLTPFQVVLSHGFVGTWVSEKQIPISEIRESGVKALDPLWNFLDEHGVGIYCHEERRKLVGYYLFCLPFAA